MAQAVVVELSKTSTKERRMGEESILSPYRRTNVEVAAHTGTNPVGQPSWKRLLYAGNTPIQRHLKIKGEANPFDPRWRSYSVQRAKGSKVRQTVADDRLSTPEGLHMA